MIVAVFMCFIAVIALTSATYAWFISISNPTVGNVQLYVSAPEAMMFSAYTGLDAANTPDINLVDDWKTSIRMKDISDVSPTGNWGKQTSAFPVNMKDVSSLFKASSHHFFSAAQSNLGELTGYYDTPIAGNDYTKFTLWAKSTRSGFVFLDSTSLLSALTLSAPGNAVADTIRIGFVPVNYDVNGTDAGGLVAGEDWDDAVIWEPNSKSHLDVLNGGPGGNAKIGTNAVSNTGIGDVALQTTYDFTSSGTNVNALNYFDGKTSHGLQTVQLADTKIALFNMLNETDRKSTRLNSSH